MLLYRWFSRWKERHQIKFTITRGYSSTNTTVDLNVDMGTKHEAEGHVSVDVTDVGCTASEYPIDNTSMESTLPKKNHSFYSEEASLSESCSDIGGENHKSSLVKYYNKEIMLHIPSPFSRRIQALRRVEEQEGSSSPKHFFFPADGTDKWLCCIYTIK